MVSEIQYIEFCIQEMHVGKGGRQGGRMQLWRDGRDEWRKGGREEGHIRMPVCMYMVSLVHSPGPPSPKKTSPKGMFFFEKTVQK